jgi:predicted DNA-binding protein with PD1-like motif
MEWQAVREGYLIRFHHGDDVIAGLLAFARARDVEGAWVNALGAIADPELGYYHLETKSYTRQVFSGEWEIASIVGNLGRLEDGAPALHVHATIGGTDFTTRGGHLFAGRAGATCEVFLRDLGRPLHRVKDEAIGLPLWLLEHREASG